MKVTNTRGKEELFKYCFGLESGKIPEKVVLSPFLKVRALGESCDVKCTFKGRLYSGIIASKNNINFAAVRSGMGGQIAGDAAALLGAAGARDIVFAGSCGGLGESKIGGLIACEKAFDGGSFSSAFRKGESISDIISKDQFIDSDLRVTEDLKNFSGAEKGNIFTVASLFSELESDIEEIEAAGFAGVDMELASVYSAAKKMETRASALLFVSDLPRTNPLWEVDTDEESLMEKIVDITLGFITSQKEA